MSKFKKPTAEQNQRLIHINELKHLHEKRRKAIKDIEEHWPAKLGEMANMGDDRPNRNLYSKVFHKHFGPAHDPNRRNWSTITEDYGSIKKYLEQKTGDQHTMTDVTTCTNNESAEVPTTIDGKLSKNDIELARKATELGQQIENERQAALVKMQLEIGSSPRDDNDNL